jgi:CubicO group peptidase (beta-lactamase class C family)
MSKDIEPKNPVFAGFDEFVNKVLADWKVPGMGIAIIKDDKVILAKGYGYRDVEHKLPVDSETLFAIGSSSKAFAAAAVAVLVDQGKLEWDKPVREYMPTFKLYDNFASERMSPRDLLCHRSGLPRHDISWYSSPLTRKELYERLRYLEPNKDFRTNFQYQNLMYMTAGYLVEYMTGLTWEEFTKKEIFKKIGMTYSNFSVEESKKSVNAAFPYAKQKGEVKQVPFRNIDAVGPAGSINSNVIDMAKWVITHLNDGIFKGKQIVSKANMNELHKPTMPIGGSFFPGLEEVKALGDMSYGLGWFMQPYRGMRLIHHGGNIDGFSALISFMPDEKLGVALLTNMNGTFSTFPITLNIYDRLLGLDQLELNDKFLSVIKTMEEAGEKGKEKAAELRKTNTQPSHPLEEYAGDFVNPGYGPLKISIENGKLNAKYNSLTFDVVHYHYDIFEIVNEENEDMTMKISFSTDTFGNIASVAVPFEASVKDIVFTRTASDEMRQKDFLAQFTGKYRFMQTQIIDVVLKGEMLTIAMMGAPETELEPYKGTQFKVKGLPASIEFKLKDGKVIGADLLQGSAVYEAEKIG